MFGSRTKMLLALLLGLFTAGVVDAQGSDCPSGYTWNGIECVMDGPSKCSGSTPYSYADNCYESCPSGTFAYFYDCLTSCPSETYEYFGNCVGGCPSRTYNRKCVDSCPEGTYDYNNVCVDSCPIDTITDGNHCYQSCPSGYYRYNGGCVTTCPSEASFMYRGGCREECWKYGFYYAYAGSKECVDSCPNFYEWKTNTCMYECAQNQKKSGTGCYDSCPSTTPYSDGDTCVLNCPRYVDIATNNCVDICPSGTNVNGNRCEKENPTPLTCNSNQYLGSDNICYDYPTCHSNQYLASDNTCRDIPTCSSNQYLGSDYVCYDNPTHTTEPTPSCSSNQYLASDNTCRDIPTCSSNQYLGSDYTCYDNTVNCNSNQYLDASNTCRDIPVCNPNQYLGSDYKCYDIQNSCQYSYAGTCVSSCPSGTLNQYGKCVERCDASMFRNGTDCVYQCDKATYNGDCFDSCPREAPLNFYGKCLTKCPEGMWEKDGQCTYECPHFWLNTTCVERCPPSTFIVNEKYCHDDCPIGFKRDGQHCDMTNYTYPCSSTQTLSSDGHCVEFQYNYTNPCGADQWMLNNTCVPACKEGEFMDMNGNCMNPAEMCQRGLPGGVYNYDTNTCECPEGQWIQRDESFVPPVSCSRADSSEPHPRINCPSFIPYTVYSSDFDNCVCDAEHPVIISNPRDSFLPFRCAAPGTETTIRPCESGLYFDFMTGKCVIVNINIKPTYTPIPTPSYTSLPTYTVRPSYTPMPSACPVGTIMIDGKCQRQVSPSPSMCPLDTVMVEGGCKEMASQSSTATRTAMPSRRPSFSASLTRTPKPSDRPGSPSSSISVSRTPRPSAAVFADVSRKPLPSVKPLPPPPVAKSPAPSPWPKKTDFVLEPEEKPAYIEAKVSVSGGNSTEMSKPEKIQEMQASLACALRMPLENILITSITYVDEKGVSKVLDIDPTKFMMAGDGSNDCYDMKKSVNTTQSRMLRALQSTGAIEVNYAIVAPSDDILAMDTNQMQQVISTSPIMIQAASSVGGTKLTATSLDALRAQISPSPSPSVAATVTGFFVDIRAAVGGGIAGVALVIGIATAFVMYLNQKKKVQQVVSEKEQEGKNRVMVIVQEQHHINPIVNMRPTVGHELPIDFSPEQTRRSAVPLRATNKGAASWGTRV